MYTKRERATILAALLFWREELCPHGAKIIGPYFKAVGMHRVKPLSGDATKRLSARLRVDLAK
jgi:hypothetical protein